MARQGQCPIDQIQITIASSHLPVNQPLLSVLLFDANDHATSSSNESILRQSLNDDDLCRFINAEHQLTRMATYLRRAESERGKYRQCYFMEHCYQAAVYGVKISVDRCNANSYH
jgi:hypothetical protein